MERLLHLIETYPLDFVSYAFGSLPIFIGLLRIRYFFKPHYYVWLLFCFFFVKDTVSLWYVYYKISNIYVQNIETLFETILVGLAYHACFDSLLSRRIILYLGVLTSLTIILSYNYERVSLVSLLLFRVYSIGLALTYFNKIIVDLRIKSILKHSIFWFSAGLLLYATGTFFISLFSEFLFDPEEADNDTFDVYWNISQLLFMNFALLAAIGLWFSKCDRTNMI